MLGMCKQGLVTFHEGATVLEGEGEARYIGLIVRGGCL